MRYLLLPLVAAFAFSSCSYEPMEQQVPPGAGSVAMTNPGGIDQTSVQPTVQTMPSADDPAANRDQGVPQTPLVADATKQPESKQENLNQPGPPKQKRAMSYNKLTDDEAYVIQKKGTEARGVGEYTDHTANGLYICRQCNAELYRSTDKFHSNCGWPSFDDEIDGSIEHHGDTTHGMDRVEIVCKNCKGHLGHVFTGERMTEKNTRHCVNSISMKFVPAGVTPPPTLIVKSK